MDDWLKLSGPQRRSFTLKLIQVYGAMCCICGLPITPGTESCQHLTPRSKGGRTSMENCRPAHRKCNSSAGNRPASPLDGIEDGLAWLLARVARFSERLIAGFHPAPAWKSLPKTLRKKDDHPAFFLIGVGS